MGRRILGDHMVFSGNGGWRRKILWESYGFLGVMKGGGGFWGIALFSGVTERGAEDFEESHGFQRQRRVEAEDFVGVMWFSGVMERGGRRILGDHMVFRGNGWGRRGILGESWFSGVTEGGWRILVESHGFQG